MKIYCDTNTLPHNIRDPAYKVQRERAALKELADKFELFSSKFVLKEVMKTPDETQRDYLIVDYRALEPVPKDERFYGSYTLSDPYGGRIENPLVSDVQDEALVREPTSQADPRPAESQLPLPVMTTRRATPWRKSPTRHAWSIIGFPYSEKKFTL